MVLELITGFLAWLLQTMQWLSNTFGLPGLFIASILENATLFIGVPLEIILVGFYFATKTNIILIAIVAGAGAAIGELTGYAVGRAGTKIAEKVEHHKIKLFQDLQKQINSKGPLAVYFLTLLPVPFDLVGLACGIAKMHPLKFFIATFLGKSTRFFIVLIAATTGIKFLLSFFGIGA